MPRKYTRHGKDNGDYYSEQILARLAEATRAAEAATIKANYDELRARSKSILATINGDYRQACASLEEQYNKCETALEPLDNDHLGDNHAWVKLRAWREAEHEKLSDQYAAKIQMWFDCFTS